MELVDPAFIQRLECLWLLARKVLGGRLQADRKSTKKGSGVTFADYAEYSPGDDLRAIDWRVFGRYGELLIKLFEVEEDATIYILLDQSRSMAASGAKFDQAKRIAAALGYIALKGHDQVVPYGIADDLRPLLELRSGRAKILRFLEALGEATAFDGDIDLSAIVRRFQARHRRRGLVLVISDFLFPHGFEDGLNFLSFHGHDVFTILVQDDSDRRCDLKGDVELECVETGRKRRVTITPREAKLYEEAIERWNASLARVCARRGIGHAEASTEIPFERVVEDILRRGGLVA